MSKAYKCDKCKIYYDKKKYDPESYYNNDPSIKYVICTAPHEYLDLCDRCYNKLVLFLEDQGSDVM